MDIIAINTNILRMINKIVVCYSNIADYNALNCWEFLKLNVPKGCESRNKHWDSLCRKAKGGKMDNQQGNLLICNILN